MQRLGWGLGLKTKGLEDKGQAGARVLESGEVSQSPMILVQDNFFEVEFQPY